MQQVGGTLVEEALELVDIIVHYRHQASSGLLGVPLHLEVLDVSVGRHSELVLGGLGQVAPQHGVEVLEN